MKEGQSLEPHGLPSPKAQPVRIWLYYFEKCSNRLHQSFKLFEIKGAGVNHQGVMGRYGAVYRKHLLFSAHEHIGLNDHGALLLPCHRRKYFKHFAHHCLQGRIAIKHSIDAVGIGVIALYNLPADGRLSKTAIAKGAQIFKLRVVCAKRLPGRA